MTATIVLNYNDSDTVIEFLKKAQELPSLGVIVIVDNCSTDDSVKRLTDYISDKILLIKTTENSGYAAGNNFGIRYAESIYSDLDKIIISNPDITITETDIQRILGALNQGYDMATGIVYNYNPKTNMKKIASNFAWKIPGYWDMICNCFLGIYKFRRKILKNNIYFEAADFTEAPYLTVQAVPGCFFAIKDSVMKEVGYFDEDTFLFEEETILGWKLRNANKKVCVVKEAIVLHENSVSIKKSIKSRTATDRILLNSECIYLKKYCKVDLLGITFYEILHKFGFIEKDLLNNLKRGIDKC